MKLLLITDTHITDRPTVFNSNLELAANFVEENPVDLVVHLGDFTADGSTNLAQLEYAATRFAAFGAPVHFIPGNHDVGDNPMAPGKENVAPLGLRTDLLNLDRLADYRRIFGPDYWTLDVEGWQLI